jgi:hypothetical protein
MNTVQLSMKTLPRIPTYLSDVNLGIDFIGQIIIQTNEDVDIDRLRLPSETKKTIHPFTVSFRNRVIDSEVTVQLIRAMKVRKGQELRNEVENILSPFYKVVWLD